MASYPTPHINAKPEDFGKTVLMPGDPLRSKFVAENYLENAVLVNNVRGVQGYTGYYDGVKISVMASGMGMPSIGIYSWELFNVFGVENIIRIGSAGAIQEKVHLRDIVIAQGACTGSSWAGQYHLPGAFAPIADFDLLRACVETAEQMNARFHVGNVSSDDVFYFDDADLPEAQKPAALWKKMGVLALEMETAGLYMNAARSGKRALGMFTVSDHILTGENISAEERQTSFREMMELALRTAVKLDK